MSEGMKWRVINAVTRSTLPPPSRLVMFVLANRADSKSAVIPDKHTPSLAELAQETGLSEATVKRHLGSLEAAGWAKVQRPSAEQMARHVPNRYALAIGSGGSECAPEPDEPGAQSEPADEGPGAQSEPRGGSQRAPAGAQSEPPSYIPTVSDLSDQVPCADAQGTDGAGALFDVAPGAAEPSRQTKARKSATRSPEDEARNKLADEITRQWWDRLDKKPVGKNAFIARRQIVLALLEAGHEPDAVAEAAKRSGISMTTGGMEYQLQRLADEAARAANVVPFQRANGHQPYRNPENQDVYDSFQAWM